jgi:hypothetical protein
MYAINSLQSRRGELESPGVVGPSILFICLDGVQCSTRKAVLFRMKENVGGIETNMNQLLDMVRD